MLEIEKTASCEKYLQEKSSRYYLLGKLEKEKKLTEAFLKHMLSCMSFLALST